MTLEAKEAYCLEILARESEKLSQEVMLNDSVENSEWSIPDLNIRLHKASHSVITQTRSPKTSRKLTYIESSIDKPPSLPSYRRREASLVSLYSNKNPTSSISPMRHSVINSSSILQTHSIAYNPRFTTAKKLQNEVGLTEKYCSKSFSPCKCVMSISSNKTYHCSPTCINKILSRQHKEYYSGKLTLINQLQKILKNKEKNTFLQEKPVIKNRRSRESLRITASPRSCRVPKIKTDPLLFITASKLDMSKHQTDCLSSPYRRKATCYASKRKLSHFDWK